MIQSCIRISFLASTSSDTLQISFVLYIHLLKGKVSKQHVCTSLRPNTIPTPYNPLQTPSPFLTLPHPPLQRLQIPRPKSALERFRVRRQARRYRITVQRVQDGEILRRPRRIDMECRDQTDEGRVQLAIREVRAGAHAGPGAIRVVRGARAFGVVEVALDREGVGVFEVRGVEVGGPGVLGGWWG